MDLCTAGPQRDLAGLVVFLNRLYGGEQEHGQREEYFASLNRLHGGEPGDRERATHAQSLNRLRGGELSGTVKA